MPIEEAARAPTFARGGRRVPLQRTCDGRSIACGVAYYEYGCSIFLTCRTQLHGAHMRPRTSGNISVHYSINHLPGSTVLYSTSRTLESAVPAVSFKLRLLAARRAKFKPAAVGARAPLHSLLGHVLGQCWPSEYSQLQHALAWPFPRLPQAACGWHTASMFTPCHQ